MKAETTVTASRRLGVALAVLAGAWILPPVVQKALHYCPVRPDGVAQASAVPAFARKYGISCSQCHVGFPILNSYGRQFKMQGYVRNVGGEEGVLKSEDGSLWTEKTFPWGLIVRSRPFDNGRGGVSNQGAQMGPIPAAGNSNGFRSQPIADVDFFIAGGDVARKISWFSELDANPLTGAGASLGDLKVAYHPSQYLHLVAARRGFFVDDPYQTISGAESPTIANRATDLMFPDQGSISGTMLTATQQTMSGYGQVFLPQSKDALSSPAFLYYAAGLSKNSDLGQQNNAPTNENVRLAFDNGAGLMIGTYGAYGHSGPRDASAFTGGTPSVPSKQQFAMGGFDALWEIGDLAARGAFLYRHDGDPKDVGAVATDRAGYAELAYTYKRGGDQHPFLLPLVRENWYTTFNGRQQFNYLTAHLAHYFAPNLKAFVEYSFDTKKGYQTTPALAATLLNQSTGALALRGNRITMQAALGF